MKRSAYLEILSHDHFEGLLIAKRLRSGIDNSVDRVVLAGYTGFVWSTKLSAHFRLEEDLLITVLNSVGLGELAEQMISEHALIRNLVSQAVEENESTDCFVSLAKALSEHIRFEERVVFPALEKSATQTELEEICQALKTGHSAEEDQMSHLAESVRKACAEAAVQGFEEAAIAGLCQEGAVENAVCAINLVDLDQFVESMIITS